MWLIFLTSLLIIFVAYTIHNYIGNPDEMQLKYRRSSSLPNPRRMGGFFSSCCRPSASVRSPRASVATSGRRSDLQDNISDQIGRINLRDDDDASPVPTQEFYPGPPISVDETCQRVWSGDDQDETFAKAFGLEIKRKDLLTLRPAQWLNDEIINFYFNLIAQRNEQSTYLPKVHVFNTFFYAALIARGYAGVRRWTKNVNIFEYSILLIPLHLSGCHWCLAAVDFKRKKLVFFDSMYTEDGLSHLRKIKEYLDNESADKHASRYSVDDFQMVPQYQCPAQLNAFDCGVFICQFGERYANQTHMNFSQEHIPHLRKQMVYEIVNECLL